MTTRAKDITGQRYGRLVARERVGTHGSHAVWLCDCDCGSAVRATNGNLRGGSVKSCGCLKIDGRHGSARRGRKTPEYLIWVAMRQRCANPKAKRFARYGGRGIQVCARWDSFDAFLADMGPRPTARHTIERKDNDGDYTANNCRWATYREQAANTSRNVIVEIAGESMILVEAVRRYGGHYGTVLRRIHAGEPAAQALRIA